MIAKLRSLAALTGCCLLWLPQAALSQSSCLYDIEILDAAANRVDLAIACESETPLDFLAGRSGDLFRFAERRDGGEGWRVEPTSGLVRLTYRLHLGRMADELDSIERAKRHGKSVMAVASSWLLRPNDPSRELLLSVKAPAGGDFASALPAQGDRLRLRAGEVPFAGYMAFGSFERRALHFPPPPYLAPDAARGRLDLIILDGQLDIGREAAGEWVRKTTELAVDYWGGFSGEQAMLILAPMAGRGGVVFGRVIGTGGLSALVQVGEGTNARGLYNDWILLHELIHTGNPFVGDGFWLMEGLATYLEPVLRARAGWLTADDVWAEFARGMPRGALPMAEVGLSRVGGRGVYWAGAIFMLMADIEIRRQTDNKKSLDDCIRGILHAGGNATRRWTLTRTLSLCDSALGAEIVQPLAAHYMPGGADFDLAKLWRDLGIRSDGRSVEYDETAPLAAIRRAIVPQ